MGFLGRLTSGKVTALLTVPVIAGIFWISGGKMFSPGALSAQGRGKELAGVRSHAELANNCSACHAEPWSKESMATRCLSCHTDVRSQLDARGPLHGQLPDGNQCRNCHTEHKGAHAVLTSMDRFDHTWTAFPLTGKHRSVDCQACHVNNVFKGTAHDCLSCHAEPVGHKGRFGSNCTECHSTSTWAGAMHKHTFPLTHHNKGKDIACAVCHTTAGDHRTYTCAGCHAHEPTKMERKHAGKRLGNIQNCVACHPTGRGHERRRAALDEPHWVVAAGCPEACGYLGRDMPRLLDSPRPPASSPIERLLMRKHPPGLSFLSDDGGTASVLPRLP